MIPQANPQANYFRHHSEIHEAIEQVLKKGQYILGPNVAAFEKEFAEFNDCSYAVATASGTDSLQLAMRTLDIGPGDAVFTVSHTAVATVAAIELTGATPVLIDIDPASYTIDPDHLKDTVTGWDNLSIKPKAVIPVHLYGHPANMDSIVDLAKQYGLYVIEDCAQSTGAKFQNKRVGTIGDIGIFSFYPTKNLGAIGDGGAIIMNNVSLYEKAQMLKEYGWRERISYFPGMNSRLDELQAAILRVKLKYLEEENLKRQQIAYMYTHELNPSSMVLPQTKNNCTHVFHQYAILTPYRDNLKSWLQQHKISTSVHYPYPVHLQPAYKKRIKTAGHLSHTEAIALQILSLPMYPELTDDMVLEVINCIKEYTDKKRN
jgi:dTDP-4-amino-4,6-dideoxygalactose transaminase